MKGKKGALLSSVMPYNKHFQKSMKAQKAEVSTQVEDYIQADNNRRLLQNYEVMRA